LLMTAICPMQVGTAHAQIASASWLDAAKPASWNTPGLPIPAAPRGKDAVESKCRDSARPPELQEDKRLRDQGWNPVGGYQGGWRLLVIRATAAYDGMCRPQQYQDFVFVRGVFAGTLAPRPMDSRTDGALVRSYLQGEGRLSAEYARYTAQDPLCCPSRTTTVVFDLSNDPSVLQPVSTSTTGASGGSASAARGGGAEASDALTGTSWQLVKFQGGDDTTLTPDDRAKYTIAFGSDGRLTARIDCNRGRGTWTSGGARRLQFGPMALTRAKCASGSLHDHLVKQWSAIRSYVIKDGHLFLSLMADGGIYEFEPLGNNGKT
jgi:heat shock protein HslJ